MSITRFLQEITQIWMCMRSLPSLPFEDGDKKLGVMAFDFIKGEIPHGKDVSASQCVMSPESFWICQAVRNKSCPFWFISSKNTAWYWRASHITLKYISLWNAFGTLLRMSWGVIAIFSHNWLMTLLIHNLRIPDSYDAKNSKNLQICL